MRVLLAAAACRPGAGSEWHVGWQTAMSTARSHSVCVVTQPFNRKDIEAWLVAHPEAPIEFHYAGEVVSWHQNRLVARMQDWLELRRWTRQAAALIHGLSKKEKFDIGHHATIASWRLPSPLAGAGLPWIWGPIGGGTSVPPAFHGLLSPGARAFERLRTIANRVAMQSPALRRCARDASVILVNSKDTGDVVRVLRGSADGIRELSQTFLTPGRIARLAAPGKRFPGSDDELKILACGTLEGLKGVALSLHALARCSAQGLRFRFRFLGKGSEFEHLTRLSHRLGLANQVSLGDWLEGEEFTDAIRSAHVYLSPSLREGVPVSLIEAMAAHCVPIVANCGGPGLVVTPDCGFSLPVESPEQLISDITNRILLLARDPKQCRILADAAHNRAATVFSEAAYLAGIELAYGSALGVNC